MLDRPSSHLATVLQALFVTFLWSTSWVIIKVGLKDIPPLTFAGLRYTLAFLCLLPLAFRPARREALRTLTRREWARLALLGLLGIAITQGAQFAGLSYLPAVTVSLFFNFTPVAVALLAVAMLNERPTGLQWMGVALYIAGIAVYFYPGQVAGQAVGLIITAVGVLTNAISAVLGRQVNREERLHPVIVTVTTMGIGGVSLLATGVLVQGLLRLSPASWLAVGWLAVVNTALAFPLWNHTLRTLSAVESSIINSTMLVQIAAVAWIFLGEVQSPKEILGMVIVACGIIVVQVKGRRKLL